MEEVENNRGVGLFTVPCSQHPKQSHSEKFCLHLKTYRNASLLSNVYFLPVFSPLLADIFTSSGKQADKIEWYVHITFRLLSDT